MLTDINPHLPQPSTYQGQVYRIVETQEYAATNSIVDNLDEQYLLEQLLDEVKPPYRDGSENLDYLISTPFRYPPLRHGSRFGTITMASFFYACEEVNTALAECAFYRFVFLDDMENTYSKAINSEHLTFSVSVKSARTMDLCAIKQPLIQQQLQNPSMYSTTQALGQYLTEEMAIDTIRYHSAREPLACNIAIHTPAVIQSTQPANRQTWICQTSTEKISFNHAGKKPISFNKSKFLVNGRLPALA